MKLRLLALMPLLLVFTLAACGGGSPTATSQPAATSPATQVAEAPATVTIEPTATVAPTTPPATATPEPTATTPPTATTVTDPAGSATGTVPTDGEPNATATVVDGEATPDSGPIATREPQRPSGENSPLAIPAAQLTKLGLEFSVGDAPDPEDARKLERNGGRQLFSNQWLKSDRKGLVGVFDERLEFETQAGAEAFLKATLTDLEKDLKEDKNIQSYKKLTDLPQLGDSGSTYEVKAKQGTQSIVFYAAAFRTGTIVSRIATIGDQTATQKQAVDLFKAADVQIDKALDR